MTQTKLAPRSKIEWKTIPIMRQAMAVHLVNYDEWKRQADEKFPNRHLLHPLYDYQYAWYQDWLKQNPEPKPPFCELCGHDHGNSDCYGEYA